MAASLPDALAERLESPAHLPGAQGGAYVGRDRVGGERVVMKRMPRSPAVRWAAKVLRQAASPHLPRIVDLVPDGDDVWIATAYVEGPTLAARLETDGPLPVETALRVAHGVAEALAELARAGTHHGDVSPANVVLAGERGRERPVLVDLGHLGGAGCGTPGYLAPEVLAGGGGPSADLFALGSVLFAALAGAPPFRRPDVLAALDGAAVQGAVAELLRTRPLPAGLADLLERLLAPAPADRPRDPAGVAARLAAMTSDRRAAGVPLVPARWPYVGDVEGRVAAVPPGARVVLVTGPAGAGRDRTLEEVALRLAEAGRRIRRLPLEGAFEGAGDEDERIVQDALDDPGAIRALALSAAGARVWVVATMAAASATADGTSIVRFDVPPLDPRGAEALASAARVGDPAAWARALVEATGGAAGRMVATLEAAAACGLAEPDPGRLAALASAADRLDAAGARRVLMAAWGLLAGDGGPAGGAGAVLAARAVLGADGVRALAAAARDDARGSGAALVAAELGDDEKVAAWLAACDRPEEDRAWPVLLEILRGRGRPAGAGVAEAVAARLLAADRAGEALRLLPPPGASAPAEILRVRALLRLGRVDEAERRLAEIGAAEGAASTLRALRIRACIDRGDFAGALALGSEDLDHPRPEAAEAAVWAAFAALSSGRGEDALAAMDRLLEGAGLSDPALRARAVQVRAGALLVLDRPVEARDAYLAAARLFESAGEPAGRAAVEAAAAQLAVVAGGDRSTIDRTRALLVRLLAQGAAARAVDAAAALVRLLLRAGDLEEAEAVAATLETVDLGPSALARARRARTRAEVAFASAVASGRPWALASVGHELARVAAAFDEAGSGREALEARLRGVVALARAEDPAAAEALLDVATAAAPTDLGERAAVAVARIEVAAARRDRAAVRRAIRDVADLGGLEALADRGRNDLVAEVAEALWVAARRLGAPQALSATLRAAFAHAHAVSRGVAMHATTKNAAPHDPLTEVDRFLEEGATAPAGDPSSARLAARIERLERMVRIYRRLAHEEDVDRLLEQIVDAMLDVTGAERGAVVIRAEDETERVVHRGLGEAGAAALSRSVLARVFEEGEAVVSVDAMEDARFESARSVSHLNLRSVLAVPLRFRGRILGAAYVDHRLRRGHFGSEDLGDVEIFADLAATAVAHARTLADLRAKAAALAERERALGELLAEREAEVEGLRGRAATEDAAAPFEGIVGTSAAMQRVFRRIRRVADADVPVVIRGESGTGKELVARAIHRLGSRAKGPFVAENCGAIPKTLLESILFGHARGAFTGADRARAGLFEAASGGTLFLDEVAELPLDVQAKLLRVLQEGEVRRVGETKARHVDVRILAATHRDLEAMVREGTFREDLYYRLDVVRLEIPPLRERIEDLPALVEALLARHGAADLRVAPEVFDVLARYDWPGNVRELENEVRRWTVLADGVVTLADLSPAIAGGRGAVAPSADGAPCPDTDLKAAVADLERRMIRAALAAEDGNISAAARRLGVSRYGLHKKIDRLGIVPPRD